MDEFQYGRHRLSCVEGLRNAWIYASTCVNEIINAAARIYSDQKREGPAAAEAFYYEALPERKLQEQVKN